MRKLIFVIALIAPTLVAADEATTAEAFVSKIDIVNIDQFTATGLLNDGECLAGVPFILREQKNYALRLADDIEKRLRELKANAWVLIDYETRRMIPLKRHVSAVQVLPMQCQVISESTDEQLES